MKIEFDYRFDTNGFFDAPERRAALEEAGRIWSELINDDFEAIPAGVQFTVQNPQTGVDETVVLDRDIDDILIFVGASTTPFADNNNIDDRTEDLLATDAHETECCCDLCNSNVYIHDLSRSTFIANAVDTTGNILGSAKYDGVDLLADIFQRRISGHFRRTDTSDGILVTDFEPWAGAISFVTVPAQGKEWDFNVNTEDLDPSKFDFVSVAIHEIGHILGVGTTPVFDSKIQNESFQEFNAKNVNNGNPIPLSSDLSHVLEGFANDSAVLDPTLNNSVRNLPSDVDKALLADIGYDIDGFTKQGFQPALATDSGEPIFGATFADEIDALGGDDTIQGNEGDDTLNGDRGNDLIFAGTGNDLIAGNEDDDELQGSTGDDTLDGGAGNDNIFGDEGNDSLIGGEGDDTLSGDFGNNSLDEAFNDTLDGGAGNDTLFGNKGNDSLIGGEGDDFLEGNDGDDNLQGNNGKDTLLGGSGIDIIFGNADNDQLRGGAGSDRLDGGDGDDILSGLEDDDFLNGGTGNDTLQGDSGTDRFIFQLNSGQDTITDFKVSEDIIEVSSQYGFKNVNEVLDKIQFVGIDGQGGFVSDLTFDDSNFVRIFHDEEQLTVDNIDLPLAVNSVTSTATGFVVTFNQEINADVLNIAGSASPDLILKNSAGKTINGSINWNNSDRTLTFVATNDILAPDDYTLTLFSRDDGFVSLGGRILDGNVDGEDGGNLVENLTVAQSDRRVLTIDNFIPELNPDTATSLNVALNDGLDVQNVEFILTYNSQLLDVTDIQLNPALLDDWEITSNLDTPGQATVSLSGTTPLNTGAVDLVSLQGEIPANAPYGLSDILNLNSVSINEGSVEVVGSQAIQDNTIRGDLDRNEIYTNRDVSLVAHLSVGLNGGLDTSYLTDPNLIADVNNDGVVSAFDSYLITTAIV
ncbi:MAG: hypothetical protein Tsb0014_40140 [Pleurocapsa sp.]